MTADIDEFARRFFAPLGGGRTRHADGSVEFVCIECGYEVHAAIDDGFDFCVCAACRFLGERPWLGDAIPRGKQAMARSNRRAQRRGSSVPTLPPSRLRRYGAAGLVRLVGLTLAAACALAWVLILSQGGRP